MITEIFSKKSRKRTFSKVQGDPQMAYDGITTAAVVQELKQMVEGGLISRIVQPEPDELQLTIKKERNQHLLMVSASPSLPLLCLTDRKKEAPLAAPNFCMLLRKHIQNGRITGIDQPAMERIVIFTILHRDEMGDLCTKKLIVELMGKHSNIIFTDDNDLILDSIRRVPSSVSSLREVLPGRTWFLPESLKRADPLSVSRKKEAFHNLMTDSSLPVAKALIKTFSGISPVLAEELLYTADIDGRKRFEDLDEAARRRLEEAFSARMRLVTDGSFDPIMVCERGIPVEYACFPLTMYAHDPFLIQHFPSVSPLIRTFYGTKEHTVRIRQKSADLRHIAATALERTNKKLALQTKQLADTEGRDKFRIYGEMLNAYGYEVSPGDRELTCENYYTGETITVPLDPTKTPSENAQKYFSRYNKLKRTREALTEQITDTESDRDQLLAILTAIDLSEAEADLSEIRQELQDYGYIQKRPAAKKGTRRDLRSEPYVYISSDGFEMLVGRNNYQNEELTFKKAAASDWWFHVKGAPGSHVILRTDGRKVPDRTFEEAAALAVRYSSLQNSDKAEVDYTQRKNLKKTPGGKPGFVIYHTYYSIVASPETDHIRRRLN